MKNMMSIKWYTLKITAICALIALFIAPSCNFLDVVPENIATIENAFRNRNEAFNYLHGLFSNMPDVGNLSEDPALWGSDEIYVNDRINPTNKSVRMRQILRNEQGTNDPVANYWASKSSTTGSNKDNLNGGKTLWTGISDCNIFLENIHKPFDLELWERERWTAEALFVKAYLHFWLFRQYGPIPLIKQNMPIDDNKAAMQYREPVDEVVKYIVELLDEVLENPYLPIVIDFEAQEMGRPTKCWAAALKAQVLTLAASPLFNCNPDYADYIDKRGVQLFPQDPSVKKEKWEKAAVACREAIEMAHEAEHRLFNVYRNMMMYSWFLSDSTIMAMQVRGAVTQPWGFFGNSEIIWGNCRSNDQYMQRYCFPYFIESHTQRNAGAKLYGPTMRMVEQFYTKNGIPIEDDEEWVKKIQYKNQHGMWEMRTADDDHRQYIRKGFETIDLHFDREARFYGSIAFDGGTFYGNGKTFNDNKADPNYLDITQFKYGDWSGFTNIENSTQTGYLCKKLIHFSTSATGSSISVTYYAFPILRLADLFLLYAETLNEAGGETPHPDVYTYVDSVRTRTGLPKVVDAWRDHAIAGRKNLPSTQAGMREIIQRERLNELAFEGSRFWDLRRWKLAEDYIHNKPIKGLNGLSLVRDEFYTERVLFVPKFEKKDYFSPISVKVLMKNTNIMQSPGW